MATKVLSLSFCRLSSRHRHFVVVTARSRVSRKPRAWLNDASLSLARSLFFSDFRCHRGLRSLKRSSQNHECPSVSCILCKYAAVALKVKTGCVLFYYDVCGVVRVECPEGRFGEQCSQTCGCQNGARCDHVSGRCSCTTGWTGVSCELREYLLITQHVFCQSK